MMDCYHYAANSGVTEAYNNIGVFFAMTERKAEALPYWKKAALCGSELGWVNLMNYFYSTKNYEDVVFCIDKLKELKHPIGYWNSALSYHFGMLGIQSDIKKAECIYQNMMALAPRGKKEEDEGGSNELLHSKTNACYNLAKFRFLTEEHTKENIDSIIQLLTRIPYVLLDQPRSNQLIEEMKHSAY